MFVNAISSMGNVNFKGNEVESAEINNGYELPDLEEDSFKSENKPEKLDRIPFWRLLYKRLTDEQIRIINETGELPEGAKFIESTDSEGYRTGRPVLTYDLFGLTIGTRQMPAGYELRNDISGFTRVLRTGSESKILRKQ